MATNPLAFAAPNAPAMPEDSATFWAPLIAQQQQRMGQPQAPMYTPEQIAQRRQDNEREYALGLLGQLSGNELAGNVGGHVLRQAMANRAPKQTERGILDPISGQFTYDPAYLQQRDEGVLRDLQGKQAAALESRAARAQTEQHQKELRAMMASNKSERDAQAKALAHGKEEDRLRGDLDALIKDDRNELKAINKVKSTLAGYVGKEVPALAQQNLVILLNKFLDPGSVVREGEFDRVVKAQGLEGQASLLWDRISKGAVLTPQAMQQISYMADLYDKAANTRIRGHASLFEDLATKRGIDPAAVVMDPTYRRDYRAPGQGPQTPKVIDVGAALNAKPTPPQALPQANPRAPNDLRSGSW